MSLKLNQILLLCFLAAATESQINYGNIYRYMSLQPPDLNHLLDLLQEPKFSRALVAGDEALRRNPEAPPPRYTGKEEERKLIYYLLGYTTSPHETYAGDFGKMPMQRAFNPVYKFWRGEDGFPDRRGDYEGGSPNDKLVPTVL